MFVFYSAEQSEQLEVQVAQSLALLAHEAIAKIETARIMIDFMV